MPQTYHARFQAIIVLLAAVFVPSLSPAGDYKTGDYDEKVVELLRIMAKDLPLRTTALKDIAPEFAVEKHEGLSWEQAVVEADARFGKRQPGRAAFLRKYLAEGIADAELSQLQLPKSMMGMMTGGNWSRGFVFGDPANPEAEIATWVSGGSLIQGASLTLTHPDVKGGLYRSLSFDGNDRLIGAGRQIQPDENGATIELTENTSGEGHTNYYHARIVHKGGVEESISYTPELMIKERWVAVSRRTDYREVYENGKLTKRMHYGEIEVDGGTQSIIKRTETFP